MLDKQEVFGVVWMDRLCGPLSLSRPSADAAIELAASIREKGIGKVDNVRAVHVAAGSDTLEYLDGAAS